MDSFFGIGIGELFFIAIIALIVLGPERLPGAIRELSKWMRTIRNLSSELTSQFSEEMKAFDDINPTKILRELTEEPTEQINKATGATKPAAKPTTTTASKAATTPAKPATPKPAPAKPAATQPATGTTAAKSPSGITSTKNITPPAPKKPAQNDVAAQPEAAETGAAAQDEPENRILPPANAADAANAAVSPADGPSAAQAGATPTDLGASEPPATPATPDAPDASGAVPEKKPEEKIVVDATPRPTVTVNGTSAAEGDA